MKINVFRHHRGRIILAFAVVLFIASLIIGAYAYFNNEILAARNEKSNELRSIAVLKQSQISAWYTDQLEDALILSQNNRLLSDVFAANATKSEKKREAIRNFLVELKLEHGYYEVIITNRDGMLLFTTEDETYQLDKQLMDFIRRSVVQKKVISTDLYKSDFNGKVCLDFIAPLSGTEAMEPLAIILRLNPDDFIYPLLSFWPNQGRTSETVLLRKEGDSILMLNELRFYKNSALNLRISLNSTDIPAVKVAGGYEGTFDGKDYRGADVLAYLNAVKGTPWFMVTKVDKAELFKDSIREARLLMLFLVFILLFTAAILSFLYTFRQRNIYKHLLQVKEEFRTTIYSIGDAVIITDKSGNLTNLNPAAEKLTGWTEKDAVGKYIEEVFRIVNEGTRQKVESPIDKVLKKGSVVGLANHTLLIAKNGKEIPIADSGAPIRDDEGIITGVVLVFRDQTEERAHQAALQESELKYRTMFETSPQAMWFYDADTLAFLEVNNAAISHYGYSQEEFLSMTILDIRPEEDIPALIRDVDGTTESYNQAGVWRHKKKNGELMFVEIISHEVIFKNKAARHVLVNDITDRKKAVEALARAENYFRTLIEKAPDGIVLLNKDGKITYASPSAIRIFSDGDSFGIPDPNKATHPDDLPKVLSTIQQVIKDPTLTLTLEYRFNTNRGRYRWVESTFSNQLSEPGIESVIINFRDISDRKHAEIEQFKLLNIVEVSLNEIYVFNSGTLKFEYANSGALRNLGYTHDEMIQLTPLDIKTEYSAHDFNGLLQPLISGEKEKLVFTTTHKRKNGSVYPVDVNLQLYRDENSSVFYAVISDITERKLAESLLKESEFKFRTLFENHAAVKLLIDAETGIIADANEAAAKFYGYSRAELIGMGISQINTLDPEKLKKIINNVISSTQNHFEFRHRKKDGSVCDVEVYSSRTDISGRVYLHSIVHDITEKKRAEQQNRILIKSIEQSPVGILITDPEGYIEYANPKFTELTGYTKEEVTGKIPGILRSDENGHALHPDIWTALNNGQEWRGEYYDVRKNGEAYWENSVVSPITDQYGEVRNFVILKEDITSDKLILAELTDAKNKAEESDRLKSSFLANMSHEIRTPMNGILGFMDLLLDSGLTGDERNEYINIVKISGHRLLNTINDIIDISKIEAGQSRLSRSACDVNMLMSDLYRFFKPEAEAKGIVMTFTELKHSAHNLVLTDTAKLESILTNLIKNALKFTRQGSIEIGCRSDDNLLNFSVTDTGMGIPKDKIDGIFNRFVQADTSLSRPYEGSGLGLAISKAYVEMLGGDIKVESEPGRGTSFNFTIPFRPVNETRKLVDEINTGKFTDLQKHIFLIAEDDTYSYSYLQKVLKSEKIQLLRALNGEEAVNICRGNPEITMVLMDIKMPVLDGYEATRQILAFRPGLPVIATTAYAFAEDRQKALSSGCVDYISKPLNKEKLMEIIYKHLR